jgi:hypothetical protein
MTLYIHIWIYMKIRLYISIYVPAAVIGHFALVKTEPQIMQKRFEGSWVGRSQTLGNQIPMHVLVFIYLFKI